MTAKRVLAATVAWLIAHDLLDATSPAFAPFSAVLLMHVTIYRSLAQALRYVGAVTAGVLVQTGLVHLAGPDLFTFVLVTLIASSSGGRNMAELRTGLLTEHWPDPRNGTPWPLRPLGLTRPRVRGPCGPAS
ncbi:aromatic acid exporter family protein [Streptomyces niveus]|uniref:aromatic acid exporter family protein n=1 Tax=Streptomyces niveus TaxID=193462 RepID=UPI0035DE203E